MFSKYKAVEAYEIRPGILIMPRYSEDGQVCEIGLERAHYSLAKITLDASLSRSEIDQIADELVHANERGPRTFGNLGDLVMEDGGALVTVADYERVSIQIYGSDSPKSGEGNVAATIRWKTRKCQAGGPGLK